MRIYLNAGFGEPIGSDDLSMIQTLGYQGVRQDVPDVGSVMSLVQDLYGVSLSPLFVVPYGAPDARDIVAGLIEAASGLWQPNEWAMEFGNECNLHVPPMDYAEWFFPLEGLARRLRPDVQLVTAGISTTSKKAIDWLKVALCSVGTQCIVGYHTYRKNDKPSPHSPQQGFTSREAEFEVLRKAAAGRRLWNTEVGWHTVPRTKGCWFWKKEFTLSNAEVTSYLTQEINLNRDAGAEVVTLYQLNDGPDYATYDQDAYGIRMVDGAMKPQAYVIQRTAHEEAEAMVQGNR